MQIEIVSFMESYVKKNMTMYPRSRFSRSNRVIKLDEFKCIQTEIESIKTAALVYFFHLSRKVGDQ